MNVFDLQAKIGLDSKEYESGLNSAKKKAATFAKVGIAAITAGTVAVTRGFVKATKATAEYGDKVDKMSQKIGISAESYQKWDYVMQRAGGSVDSLKMGMKTLSKQAESNSDAFQKLGISQEEVKNSSQEELFEATVKGLSKMEAGTERAALASQLLGRAGVDLGPLLNQGSKAIEEQMDIAERYGMIMPDAAVKASAAFQDSLTTLQMTFTGLRNRLMAEFLPSITKVTDGLAKVFAGDMSGTKDIEKGINEFIGNIKKILPEVMKIGESIFEPLLNSALTNLPKAMPTIIDAGVKIITALVQALIQSAPLLIDGLFQIIESTINALKEVDWSSVGKQFIDQLKNVFQESPGALIAVLTGVGLKLGKALIGGFGSALGGAGGLSGALGSATGGASAAGGGFLGDPARTAKGLASVGIIIGGVTAIVEAFGALNKIPGIKEFTQGGGDLLKEVFSAIGKIATPQTAGIFAAIEGMGMLGVGTAVSGLASFAALIGGITLIVEAFGALDKIPGIEKFTQGGGELLALVMQQIGRAAGAIVEGFAVEVTAGLPEIGANLAGFATAAQPFFDMCANADFSGMDGFAEGIMSLVKADIGNKLSEFLFGSGYDFEAIGQELAKFSSAMIDYFVSANAAGDTEAGIKLMEAAGHITELVSATKNWEAGWGEANLEGLGKALTAYATEVKGFFTEAAGITVNLDAGIKLLSVAGDISKLAKAAKSGSAKGVLGFKNVGTELTEYAKQMADFFTIAANITDIDKGMALLEKSTAISQLSETVKNYKSGSLSKLGSDLVSFANSYKTFSEGMEGQGEVDVSGAVSSVKKLSAAAKSGGDALAKSMSGINKSTSSALSSIKDTFKSGGDKIAKAADFSSKVKTAMKKTVDAVNNSKSSVKTSINGISSLFSNTKFKFNQYIPLPHFYMTGSFDAKTKKVPTVGVRWYRKAMEQPYLFDSPTFFGAGEAGDEMLYGRKALKKDIADAVKGNGQVVINLNYDASDDANRMMQDLTTQIRRYRMAGVI